MNHRLTRIALTAAALSIGGIGAFASTATATFHENLIREAHEGTGSVGDYVELQAYQNRGSALDTFVSGEYSCSMDVRWVSN